MQKSPDARSVATDLALDLPIHKHTDRVTIFGDSDTVHRYALDTIEPDYAACRQAVARLKHLPQADVLGGNERKAAGQLVMRIEEYAIKYCWEASALEEAVANEVMREGLEQLAASNKHGIRVPKVIGGVSISEGWGGSGILITEFVPEHTEVALFGRKARGAFQSQHQQRAALFQQVLDSVGLGLASSVVENPFDDHVSNTLWPDCASYNLATVPSSSVRVDFGRLAQGMRLALAA